MRLVSRGIALGLCLLLLIEGAWVHPACAESAPMAGMHHGSESGPHRLPSLPMHHLPCPPVACDSTTTCATMGVPAAVAPTGLAATVTAIAWPVAATLPPTPATPPDSPPPRA